MMPKVSASMFFCQKMNVVMNRFSKQIAVHERRINSGRYLVKPLTDKEMCIVPEKGMKDDQLKRWLMITLNPRLFTIKPLDLGIGTTKKGKNK